MCRTFVMAGPVARAGSTSSASRICCRSSSSPAPVGADTANGIVADATPRGRSALFATSKSFVSIVCPNIIERPRLDHGRGPIRDEQHQVGDCARLPRARDAF